MITFCAGAIAGIIATSAGIAVEKWHKAVEEERQYHHGLEMLRSMQDHPAFRNRHDDKDDFDGFL